MFKKYSVRTMLLVTFVSILLPLGFQNCAKAPSEQSEEMVLALSLEAEHVDREHGTPIAMEKTVVEARSEDLISDRVLLLNQLQYVFGPRVFSHDTDGIRTGMATFGSPCSLYEAFNYEVDAKDPVTQAPIKRVIIADGLRACANQNSPSFLKATLYPKSSVIRQGVLSHLCLNVATDPLALTFALAKIQKIGVPDSTEENILKAFKLFYRHKPPPSEALIQSLLTMIPTSGVTQENWAPVLYTLCVSPGWQVL